MDIRLTAQLVLSDQEATLAYSLRNHTRGPSGETHVAVLLSTSDGGNTWARIPLARTFLDAILHWGYPTWPPEAVTELVRGPSGTQMIFRDEWVPFEPGGESLWKSAQHRNGKWSTSRIRYMDYEGADCPQQISQIALSLPPAMKNPDGSLLEDLVLP